ncbi:hypothetical protein [Candidatus Tisiphia endosymbiont of Dascillus cervinus]|uniref:hypothetical protein n=1 Tax=Candidatus Tisiphia endosymbiont of Dascillus cervinus TaxID=3066253 RepID=UPI0039777A52
MEIIDLLRNSTSAGDLYVDAVLESVTELEYAAVRGEASPSNPSAQASFERGLLKNEKQRFQSIEIKKIWGSTSERQIIIKSLTNHHVKVSERLAFYSKKFTPKINSPNFMQKFFVKVLIF